MDWKEIDSAPTDGTMVLVCNGFKGDMYAPEAAYYGIFKKAKNILSASGSFLWRTERGGIKIYPTHWMPLPQPPPEY